MNWTVFRMAGNREMDVHVNTTNDPSTSDKN